MISAGKRRRAFAATLAAVLLLAGIGNSVAVEQTVSEDTVTTGHTTLITSSTGYSDCLAGIAGLIKHKVTWFNGQTLFEQPTGAGKFVYFTEHFVPSDLTLNEPQYDGETGIRIKDPSNEKLFRTNETFRFKVPDDDTRDQDREWVVKEYFALREQNPAVGDADDQSGVKRVYVYVVQVAEDTETASSLNDARYNFAAVVDTCRFHGETGSTTHDSADDIEGDQHNGTVDEHPHGTASIDVWVGGEPNEVPYSQEINDNTSNAGEGSGGAS